MSPELKKAFINLHLAVFIFGFTAIIGKLISTDHFTLVWHRMWLAGFGFLLLPGFIKRLKLISTRHLFQLMLIGVLVAIHWLTFYGSIKIGGSASLTLGCFGLTSAFAAIIEPIVYKRKFRKSEALLGLSSLVGIILIALSEGPDITGNALPAMLMGIFSTFVAALFSTLNSTYTKTVDTTAMTFVELISGFFFLCIILLFNQPIKGIFNPELFQLFPAHFEASGFYAQFSDIIWLLVLAWLCTNIAFVMNLNAMKHVSAFTANLVINLEPVYGIILAAFLLGEYKNLNLMFYCGAVVILAGVVIHSKSKNNVKKYQSNPA